MVKIARWFAGQSDSIKAMAIIGVVALLGVILRWGTIKQSVTRDFNNRFGVEQVDTTQTRAAAE